jgi:hypothetical protein
MYEEFMYAAKLKNEDREVTNRTVVWFDHDGLMHCYMPVGAKCFVTERAGSGIIYIDGLALIEISIESLRSLRNGKPKGGVSNGKKKHCTDHDN